MSATKAQIFVMFHSLIVLFSVVTRDYYPVSGDT